MSLLAISPIDGRYSSQTKVFDQYFSEYALQKYRLWVEIEYFIALNELKIMPLKPLTAKEKDLLRQIIIKFNLKDAQQIKKLEAETNHDVKAIEYFLKKKLSVSGLKNKIEFIHFGLTSQDINNTAFPSMIRDAQQNILIPVINDLMRTLKKKIKLWASIPMLARTHGQPASPTTVGKELAVFYTRLSRQLNSLKKFKLSAKFAGATGNFNAHVAAYPQIDWLNFAKNFVNKTLKLEYIYPTTQIDPYDHLAEWCQILVRLNNILINFNRDIWHYISLEYFKPQLKEKEIGSSTMPHKINPINFENSEGNLGLANALLQHLVEKLPISRLQRDLTDSTVLRNIGVPVAHAFLAIESTAKGFQALQLHQAKLKADLIEHWVIVSEGIQTVLRSIGYPKPYEALKKITRGKVVNQKTIESFIDSLNIPSKVKTQLKSITPFSYTGIAEELAINTISRK